MTFADFHDVTISDLLSIQADRYPDRICLQQDGQRLGYREVNEQASALAAGLIGLGLHPGDRLGVILLNSPEFVVTLFGALRAGLILVPVNVRRSQSEALARLSKTQCRALVLDHTIGDESDQPLPDLGIGAKVPGLEFLIDLAEHAPDADGVISWRTLLSSPDEDLDLQIQPGDPAVIAHTLGYSGEPNGALLAHRSMVRNAATLAANIAATPDDVFLGAIPFSNTFGLTATILTCAAAGARLICLPAYHPNVVRETIAREQVTIYHGVPTMFAMDLKHPGFDPQAYASLRTGLMAGAPCPPDLVAQVRKDMGFKVLVAYGLSEASPGVTMTRLDDGPITTTETVGHPLDGVEIKVVNSDGLPLPKGESGELCVRGYNVMLRYWDDPEATARVLDANGWLHTGDLAIIDPDGPVRIVGRTHEVIIRSGFKIHPGTVEMTLYMHPAVREVAVVGVPDLIYGELNVACVVRRAGFNIEAEELLAFAAEKLPDYAVLDRVVFFNSLPRWGSGPVQKEYLRARVRIRGRAWEFGKNIDTDAIIPARRCNTADPRELALYCMEDADPEFVNQMQRGDLIVADTNFGCGSSREVAPLAIKAAGVSAVIAKSFARIFFRNAINIGLPILECPEAVDSIRQNDEVEVEPATGLIRNVTRGETYQAEPFPDFLQRIIEKGGLLAYVEERLGQEAEGEIA